MIYLEMFIYIYLYIFWCSYIVSRLSQEPILLGCSNPRFSSPCRPWKYNQDIDEFFVEDDTVVKLKKADIYRDTETTELEEP